jgi:acyl transferase domain-containing protein
MASAAQPVREETYKQALLKATATIRELLKENAALQKKEPIAVVGMACRFPGGANSPEQFWTLLRDGIDAITDVPTARWAAEAYYAADQGAPGKMYTVRGGFLDGPVDQFDASFFGISPREARALDPQHRLLLEISWEALEHACLDPTRLKNSKTGVFVGMSSDDYALAHRHSAQPERIDAYSILGTTFSTAVGRLSYTLGLQGPCMALDTACSSSLVSLHLACQSLRTGESDLALAGGVNLILSPQSHICFSKLQAVSPEGKCKTFDASADGYVRGEGCGMVVLKRLRDALTDGNRILAVVKGSAINQDGKTNGLAAPNGNAQRAVILQALEDAALQPAQVDYVEAHGTGTVLGDPIEVEALGAVFGPGRQEPLRLGAVKTNIGHLEPAAGIAGFIKIILSLQHEELPSNLHFQRPNPYIAWESLPLQVVSERSPWKRSARTRVAGLSSFGFSGTNAHVIVEEAPPPIPQAVTREPDSFLLCVSARDEHALRALATDYLTILSKDLAEPVEIGDLCYSASAGRPHWSQRMAIEGRDKAELRGKLLSFLHGREEIGLTVGHAEEASSPDLAFLFTGQGSQYPGMGRGLYQTHKVFKQAIDRCDTLLRPLLNTSLVELLFAGKAETLNQTVYAQPALFALEYALSELWASWGIRPRMLMGHSVGEYVAACVAGVFSLGDAIRLIAERGRLMQALPSGGSMAAISASPDVVAAAVAPHAGRVGIAALNGPQHIVISGEQDAVQAVTADLQGKGIRTTPLAVSHAFHSHLMEPMLATFERVARQVAFAPPRIKLVSNLTGKTIGSEITSPRYWVNHIRQPVAFAAGMKTLQQDGIRVFVELGPQSTLLGMGRHCMVDGETQDADWLPSLRPNVPDQQNIFRSLGALYVKGAPVNWAAVYRDQDYRWTTLPHYPFQRKRFWIDSVRHTARPNRGTSEHPLLGRRLQLPALARGEVRYEQDLDRGSFVRHHRVFQRAILPAAAYLEMALAAASRNTADPASLPFLQDVTIPRALVIDEDQDPTIQLVLTPASFEIYSLTGQAPAWTCHVSGQISHAAVPPLRNPETAQAEFDNEIDVATFYQQCRKRGLDYGPDFQVLQQLWQSKGRALGFAQLPERMAEEAAHYHIHPVLLDACLQVLLATLPESSQNETWLPVGLKRFQLYRSPGAQLWCRAQLQVVEEAGQQTFLADLSLIDPNGQTIGVIEQLRTRKADPAILLGDQPDLESWLYGVDWQPQGLRHPRATAALLPKPAELAEDLGGLMTELTHQFCLDDYGKALDELDSLCVAYVLAAFRDMGHAFRPHDHVSTSRLAEDLAIADAHRPLLNRMLAMLAEDGILQANQTGWQVIRAPDLQHPDTAWQSLRSRHPRIEVELDLLRRCGSALARVLQGQCDPVSELLFPGGDGSLVAALYRLTPAAQVVNQVLREGLLTALKRLPPRCGIRILEIGAGTGGTTASLLPHMAEARTEYIFTDISAAFASQAEATFAQCNFVRYQTLDIEKDPLAQGLTLHGYDIVVASNVLHATEDLATALQHTRRLLAPGGMVFLLEGTAPQRWVDLVFGMTNGWWRFRDKQLRPSHPLLSTQQWCDALRANNFEQAISTECAPVHQSLIVARANETPAENRHSEHWLIFADSGATPGHLEQRLCAAGSTCTLVYPGTEYAWTAEGALTIDPYQADHYQRLLAELTPAGLHHCVHLWSLDATSQTDDSTPLVSSSRLSWETTLLLVQALGKARLAPRLALITRGAISVAGEAVPGLAMSPLWGMGKSIALEHPEFHCVRIDLAPHPHPDEASAITAELTSQQTENQVAFRNDNRYVARLNRFGLNNEKLPSTETYALGVPSAGTLDGLAWQPAQRRAPDAGEVEIQVHSAGLNFKDVLLALHMVPAAGSVLGAECVGQVVRVGAGVTTPSVGQAVMAMAPGSLASHVTVPAHAVTRLPAGVSHQAAATLPVAFLTAMYALQDLANLQPGQRVLIHAATGGVGQAAIQVAQAAGAEIFATASEGKWEVLRALGVKHIMNSRSLDFVQDVRRLTKGQGVDVVLNSLAGEFATQSLTLLQPGGRFVEIGIRDARPALAPGVRYEAFDLLQIYQHKPEVMRDLLARVVAALESGKIQPIPHTVYPMQSAKEALRLMQQAKHTGKLVLSFQRPSPPNLHKDATYLITGGLGGLGLVVAKWMAENGAGHLVLASRRHLTPEVEEQLQAIKQAGAEVTVFQTDVSSSRQVAHLLAQIKQMRPLRGIIHAAGILDDGVISEQDRDRFAKVLAPKVDGAWHLHKQTQTLPLDFFILFSSATSLLGAVGQSNHVSANAFLDALAHHRRAQGLPGLSINWGAWSEIGYAAQVQAGDFLKTQGMGSIAPSLGLAALERVFHSSQAQVGVVPIDWSTYLRRTTPSPYLLQFQSAESDQHKEQAAFRQILEATPAAEQHALLTSHVMSQIATVLRFPASTRFDPKQGFFDMGMDSLTSVELRNLLQTALGRTLPSTLAFDFPNVSTLVDYLAGNVLTPPPSPDTADEDDLKTLEQLSETEAEATLLRELEEIEGRELSS